MLVQLLPYAAAAQGSINKAIVALGGSTDQKLPHRHTSSRSCWQVLLKWTILQCTSLPVWTQEMAPAVLCVATGPAPAYLVPAARCLPAPKHLGHADGQ